MRDLKCEGSDSSPNLKSRAADKSVRPRNGSAVVAVTIRSPRSQLEAPPSRKEREKGRAPAFVCGESMGQPPRPYDSREES